jgi:uroporphyrinogen-III decarboxylase
MPIVSKSPIEFRWSFLCRTGLPTWKNFGKTCCISGNVPSSLMVTGEYSQVKEYCRKPIEICAPGGGFVLAGSAQVDEGNPDNLRAMMDAAKEYGVY